MTQTTSELREQVRARDAAAAVTLIDRAGASCCSPAEALAETYRVLVRGGRIGTFDIVAEDDVTPDARAERGSYVGCLPGALSRSEYLDGFAAVTATDASVPATCGCRA